MKRRLSMPPTGVRQTVTREAIFRFASNQSQTAVTILEVLCRKLQDEPFSAAVEVDSV